MTLTLGIKTLTRIVKVMLKHSEELYEKALHRKSPSQLYLRCNTVTQRPVPELLTPIIHAP